MFSGSMVAIITPFKDGKIDFDTLQQLVERQIAAGTKGIVPCGTTGESATMSHDEHHEVVAKVIEFVGGRVPVIAGSGSNSTAEAISLTQHAEKAGATGALVITPYYNKPTQEGLYQHFKAIADNTSIPLVLYNVPGRTGINMLPATVARLAPLPTVTAIKEASGNITQMAEIRQRCGDNITLLSGDDAMLVPVLALGGAGVISVVANVCPGPFQKIIDTFNAGDLKGATAQHLRLLPLMQAMFLETNPIPVKCAASILGLCRDEMRLPLCHPSAATRDKLAALLQELGLNS